VTSLLMRLGLQALLERALEEVWTHFVGRERYARAGAPAEELPAQGNRNGSKPEHVDTAEGRVDVAIPQVRQSEEPFQASRPQLLSSSGERGCAHCIGANPDVRPHTLSQQLQRPRRSAAKPSYCARDQGASPALLRSPRPGLM
jgi:hypothetical protein